MGNRAVIAFGDCASSTKGIYVHWNGGRASIEGFLAAASDLNLRSPEQVRDMIKLWMGNSTVELARCDHLDCDNYDNGVYIVERALERFEIIGRLYQRGDEEFNAVKTENIRSECVAKWRESEVQS